MGVTVFTDDGNGMKISNVLLDDGDIKLKNGYKYYFDTDLDTYLSCGADDILDLFIGGSKDVVFKTNNVELQAGTFLTSINTARSITTYGTFMPNAAQEALSGPSAVSIITYFSTITTTGTDAFTLADSEVIGQIKKIQMIADGGDGTLTPTTLNGGTTITFTNIGDTVELMWGASGWTPLALYNVADGDGKAPTLA